MVLLAAESIQNQYDISQALFLFFSRPPCPLRRTPMNSPPSGATQTSHPVSKQLLTRHRATKAASSIFPEVWARTPRTPRVTHWCHHSTSPYFAGSGMASGSAGSGSPPSLSDFVSILSFHTGLESLPSAAYSNNLLTGKRTSPGRLLAFTLA